MAYIGLILMFSYVGRMCMKKLLNWIIPAAFGLGLWFVPTPEGLTPQSWHLFAIFVATIVGFITQPLPIGGVSHRCYYCCCIDRYIKD